MGTRKIALAAAAAMIAALGPAAGAAPAGDVADLPANTWTLLHAEDDAGGKCFARLICADNVDRLYLWGTGGKKPQRHRYERYELECLSPTKPGWRPAFPAAAAGKWTAESYPPFYIHGQGGPGVTGYTDGPRIHVVGGYGYTNRVRWHDFDGVKRPSPILTFNQICWDAKRKRAVVFSDDATFALDPTTNAWCDLAPPNHPACCRTLAWAATCHDPINDEIVLFGGGLATNREGGARTWIYDCAKNRWRRPALDVEPPLRCNPAMVYDPAGRGIVLFGGYDQAAALNDTWVYDCRQRRWERRAPAVAPPPMLAPGAAAVPGEGKVLVVGYNALTARRTHSATRANQETWLYDALTGTWAPVGGDLKLPGCRWLTAAASKKHGVVFLVAFGRGRRTYAFRHDPSGPAVERKGARPGTRAWKYPRQRSSLAEAPPPDPEAHAKVLADLPANRFVDAAPPGLLVSKTWSTACIDTDRSEVIYFGGGHSGYTGNDIARYSIADNRWSQDFPPRFPPFLEGTNSCVFGWTYGGIPMSQHTYLWYDYDPVSKAVVLLARTTLKAGLEVRLTDDPRDRFVYDPKRHGRWTWVYDSAAKAMRPPAFGRPFKNTWHLCVLGTPRGVYAMTSGTLYHATVRRETGQVAWKTVEGAFPRPKDKVKYHYEFQPMVYDSKRDRLIHLMGTKELVRVHARPLAAGGTWRAVETTGSAAIGREAVYVPRHDAVLWLGFKRLGVLDCATNRLTELDVEMPEGLYSHECAMVYDPAHDVCVALVPRRFSGPMRTFLFRYDPAAARHRGAG